MHVKDLATGKGALFGKQNKDGKRLLLKKQTNIQNTSDNG